mmetsp:Transcript_37348/g.105373  ORF Transcript_37348/g.105373 Transcript_37348/m.105373 type:complete len:231 (-) Transcript_37348:390-1082(-)
MPLMGGTAGLPPVAITAVENFSTLPLTSTASLDRNFPRPWKTSTPISAYRALESAGEIWARSLRIRSMTFPKSTFTSPQLIPNSAALRASWAARAARISALLGTHPTLRQSPPIRCSSMMATFPPRPAAIDEDTRPPAPAPMHTMLYFGWGSGSIHFAGCTLSRSFTLCSSRGETLMSFTPGSRLSAPSYSGRLACRSDLPSLPSRPVMSLFAHIDQLAFCPASSVAVPP